MNVAWKRRLPRVGATSKYSLVIGIIRSTPNLIWWLPFIQVVVFIHCTWLVCWNFGMKFGEPIRMWPSMSTPTMPPATVGSLGTPLKPICSMPLWPNGSCCPSLVPRAYDTRDSFTRREPSTLFQPPTTACESRKFRPQADVEVPSSTPPNQPGTKRTRLLPM